MADNWLKLWNERQLLDAQPDVVPMELDNASETDHSLAQLNLAYIPSICSIACIECCQLVIPSHLGIVQTIKTHLVDNHGIKKKAANALGLEVSLKDLSVAPEAELKRKVEEMINSPSPPNAIPHLKLYYGWSCPLCIHYRTNENSMKTHVSKQHTGTRRWKEKNNPRDPGNRAWVQEVLAVMGRRIIKVAPPNVIVDETQDFEMVAGEKKFDFAAERKKMLEDFVRTSMPRKGEHRQSKRVTTWEERMQWNTYGSIELLNEMRGLISKGNDDIYLARIQGAVTKALRTGLADIARTDPFTLKQLKSPGVTVGLRPFRTKQEDATHKRYFGFWSDMFIFFYQLLQDEEKEEKSGIKFSDKVRQGFFDLHRITSAGVYDEEAAAEMCVEISFDLMRMDFPQKLMASPLLNYVAVMSWCIKESGFYLVNNVTPRIAGFIFSAKTMVLRQVWKDADAIISESPGKETTPLVRELMDHARKYLVDYQPYPMGELISTLALGKTIVSNSWIAGNVVWEKDGKGLRYKGEYFGLNEYRGMVHQLVAEAERLAKELLFQDTLPEIDLDSIADDHSNGTAGYSYVFDFRNDFEGYFQYLMNKIETDPVLRDRFTHNGVLKRVEGLRYLQLAQKFLRVMAALMHHTGGLPPRGTEMMDISTCNLGLGDQRGVYIYAGLVMLVIHYNKTQAMTGMAKIIPRFLPNSVSKLLVIYQLFITPFVNYLTRETAQVVDQSPYLFVDHTRNSKWTAEEYSVLLGTFGKELMDFDLKIARHRQIISSVSKRCMELLAAYEEHLMDRWMASVHQFGHSKKVDDLYGLEADMMTSLTARAIEQYRAISRQVHHFLGIESYPVTPWYLGPYHMMPEGWMPAEARANAPQQPQPQQLLLIPIQPQQQQRQLPPPIPLTPLLPPVRTHCRQVPREVYAGLQANHFESEKATFSSQGQANACRMIYEQNSPLLIILKTGNGKTDNILTVSKIPTVEVKTLTILILPFKAACIDIASRAASRDIPVHFWTAEATPSSNEAKAPKQWGIVVVTPETAGSSHFRVWAAARYTAGCLGRIVFDEVHELVLAEAYRSFQNVKILVKSTPVQLVLMSATVPPTMTYAIKDFFRLDNLIECRSETNRSNIMYWVFEVENPFQQVLHVVRETWPEENKILVFCRLKQATKALKKAIEEETTEIPCYVFHADLTDDEKKETLELWNKTGGILAATTSFGSAIDTKNLALVLGLGAPYSLAEYLQQSGRGGREGQETTAILYHTKDDLDALRVVDYGGRAWKNADRVARLEYLTTKGCRRVAISTYVDQEVAECRSNPEFVWCDNCNDLHGEEEESIDSKPPVTLGKIGNAIISFFEYCVEDSCVICAFLSYTALYDVHETKDCPWLVDTDNWVNRYKPTDENHACYRCGLPPFVCTPQSCRFQSRALHNLAFFAISDSEVRDRLKVELDFVDCPLDSLHDWLQYLQSSAEFEGRKVTNLWSLAVALYKLGLFPQVN